MDDLLTMTITIPASKVVLEERLLEHIAERDRRSKGRGLSNCLSDQWLCRDIAILEKAIKECQ